MKSGTLSEAWQSIIDDVGARAQDAWDNGLVTLAMYLWDDCLALDYLEPVAPITIMVEGEVYAVD